MNSDRNENYTGCNGYKMRKCTKSCKIQEHKKISVRISTCMLSSYSVLLFASHPFSLLLKFTGIRGETCPSAKNMNVLETLPKQKNDKSTTMIYFKFLILRKKSRTHYLKIS